jgi:tripartite-type tricarboxylate transporter receptor subunit TctC
VMRMNAELVKALSSEDMKHRLSQQAVDPTITTPEEFGAYLLAEQAKYAKIVKAIGLKPD